MNLLEDITPGCYFPGNSSIHRLDPRIKLTVLPLLVIASFTLNDISSLVTVAAVASGLTFAARLPCGVLVRGLRPLRWFLAISLLMHLFLSPGHTLFGITWLSRDGLFRGIQVCAQLVLALWFSSLLTLTTTPRDLARACGSLFSPLERFGFPVRDTALFFLLVLQFIPMFREEAAALDRSRAETAGSIHKRWTQRMGAYRDRTAALILQVVERTDRMARESASGNNETDEDAILEPFPPVSPKAIMAVTSGLLTIGLFIGFLP